MQLDFNLTLIWKFNIHCFAKLLAIMEKGAKSVRALCTHPVLSGKAYANIEKSKLAELIVCDTIPLKGKSKKIKVLNTAKLFARAIRNTHEHRSISALFVEG